MAYSSPDTLAIISLYRGSKMCSGRGVPGSRTTSSGNSGSSATKSPDHARKLTRFFDCTTGRARLDLRVLTCRRGEYNPSMELTGKVVVVTGASMGIGEAIAKIFAEQGASVVLLSRDTARAEAARARIGYPDRTIALSCDVRHSEEIDRVLALTLHHFKRIDIWINNAGHGLLDSVAQIEHGRLPRTVRNQFLRRTSRPCRRSSRSCASKAAARSSTSPALLGTFPLPFHAAYSATKFALNAIGKAAASRIEERRHSRAHGLSRLRAHSFRRECGSRKRTEDGASGVGSRHHRGARRPRHARWISESRRGK